MQVLRRDPSVSTRGWRNGSMLIINEAFRHIQFPIVDELFRYAHELSVALTVPKKNDLKAQELIERIGELLCLLDRAAEAIEQADISAVSRHAQEDLIALQRIYDRLVHSVTVLQNMQKSGYATKFASHIQFMEWMESEKEELAHITGIIPTHLSVFTIVTKHVDSAQSQRNFDQSNKRLNAAEAAPTAETSSVCNTLS